MNHKPLCTKCIISHQRGLGPSKYLKGQETFKVNSYIRLIQNCVCVCVCGGGGLVGGGMWHLLHTHESVIRGVRALQSTSKGQNTFEVKSYKKAHKLMCGGDVGAVITSSVLREGAATHTDPSVTEEVPQGFDTFEVLQRGKKPLMTDVCSMAEMKTLDLSFQGKKPCVNQTYGCWDMGIFMFWGDLRRVTWFGLKRAKSEQAKSEHLKAGFMKSMCTPIAWSR